MVLNVKVLSDHVIQRSDVIQFSVTSHVLNPFPVRQYSKPLSAYIFIMHHTVYLGKLKMGKSYTLSRTSPSVFSKLVSRSVNC